MAGSEEDQHSGEGESLSGSDTDQSEIGEDEIAESKQELIDLTSMAEEEEKASNVDGEDANTGSDDDMEL